MLYVRNYTSDPLLPIQLNIQSFNNTIGGRIFYSDTTYYWFVSAESSRAPFGPYPKPSWNFSYTVKFGSIILNQGNISFTNGESESIYAPIQARQSSRDKYILTFTDMFGHIISSESYVNYTGIEYYLYIQWGIGIMVVLGIACLWKVDKKLKEKGR
jgi:hypothetical protein